MRSAPTTDRATWCPTPAAASASRRLRVEVSKNSSTAASSNEGEFDTSTTTAAPSSASARPSPVSVLTPEFGDAGTASWPWSRSLATSFDPMSPLPPITTSFMRILSLVLLDGDWRECCGDRPAQEPGIEQHGLGCGQLTGRPQHAVLAVQLGGERPAGERAVEPFLGAPDGELAVAVEPEPEAGMAEHVVDTAEPVVGAAAFVAHQGVVPVGLGGHRGDLEQPVVDDRADELRGVGVGRRTGGERDVHPVGPIRRRDPPEQPVGLGDEPAYAAATSGWVGVQPCRRRRRRRPGRRPGRRGRSWDRPVLIGGSDEGRPGTPPMPRRRRGTRRRRPRRRSWCGRR